MQWNGFSVVWKFKSSATKSNETWEATTCTNFQARITWYEAKMHRNFPQNAMNSQNTSGKENLSTLINLVGRLPCWYEWDMVVKRSQKNQLGFHTSNKTNHNLCKTTFSMFLFNLRLGFCWNLIISSGTLEEILPFRVSENTDWVAFSILTGL